MEALHPDTVLAWPTTGSTCATSTDARGPGRPGVVGELGVRWLQQIEVLGPGFEFLQLEGQ